MSPDVPTADFGTRFSAFMIDAAVLFSAQWVIFIVLSRQLQAVGFTQTSVCNEETARLCEGPSTVLWAILLLVLVGSTIAYHAVFEGLFAATPGKRWMGLQVIDDQDPHGGPIGLATGALRSVVRQTFWLSLFFVFDASPLGLSLPPVLFVGLPLIGMALVALGAVNAEGKSAHDLVANTRVVRTNDVRPASPRKITPPKSKKSTPSPADNDLTDEDGSDIETTPAPNEESEESV